MTTTFQIQELFLSQISGHANELAGIIKEKFGEVEGLDTTIQEYLASVNLNMDTKPSKTKSKTKSTPKEPKTRKERDPEGRCQARVWGDGDGTAQCSFGAGANGLCTKHSKCEAEACLPCQVTIEGKVKGLYMGRITEFQEGEPNIPPYKDSKNIVRIFWTSGDANTRILDGLKDGSHTLGPSAAGRRGTKMKSASKKKTQTAAAEELASAMDSPIEEASLQIDEPNTNDPVLQAAEEMAREKEELFGSSDEEDNEVEEAVHKPVAELVDAIESETVEQTPAEAPAQEDEKADDDDDDEEAPEVVEKLYEGALFYVEKDGTDIYHLGCHEDSDEYGELIGQWVDGKPELEEEWKHLLWKE